VLYRNRENLNLCKDHGIRLYGPKLGLPPKVFSAKDKKLARQDARDRIPAKEVFGVAKRRYSFGLIMTKQQETSESVIAMQFLLMDLAHSFRFILPYFQRAVFRKKNGCFSDLRPRLRRLLFLFNQKYRFVQQVPNKSLNNNDNSFHKAQLSA